MVLQTPAEGGPDASVFGYALPGELVVVNQTIAGSLTTYSAVSDSAGRWRIVVAPSAADLTPRGVSFSIAAASDAAPLVIRNASYGEVILCNGQSNLVLSVAGASDPVGRASPPSPPLQLQSWPNIRLFSVITENGTTPARDLPLYINRTATRCTWGYVANVTPAQELVCQSWQAATPGVTDFFSAECFYAAHALIERGAIPADRVVGLIQSAYSGTAMETWIPPEALDGCPAKPWSGAGAPQRIIRDIPSDPSCLWNTMIYPIVGYGLRAIIHNQIESNMGDSFEYYACVFQNMIASWRARWGIGAVPFLSTGLGDQGFSPDDGGKSFSFPSYVATPRDAQAAILPGRYARGVSRTERGGLVSAYDVGDRVANPFGVWDVHSRFKGEVGRRMALALQNATGLGTGGAAVDWDGPRVASATARADGTIALVWAADGGTGIYANGTQDCWECCDGSLAADTFQLTTTYAGPNMTHGGDWVNTTFVWDAASATIVLTPTLAAAPGKPYAVVRYAPSLWPQCALYSASNDVPALAFSDRNITAAPAGASL